MSIEVVFETHSITEDNESGHATGWRLRECDYGRLNGAPTTDVHANRSHYLDQPYPDGESWRQAVDRVGRFLADLPSRWNNKRVLVVGHVATRWGLDHFINGIPLETLAGQNFEWQEGWEYRLSELARSGYHSGSARIEGRSEVLTHDLRLGNARWP
jgi:hypothetical protein